MSRRSFADVKAHLSEVVDQAEHRGKKIVILRHGKPAAAIVPACPNVPATRDAASACRRPSDAWTT